MKALIFILFISLSHLVMASDRDWQKLNKDDLHAIDNPALAELQNPEDGFKGMPGDYKGIGNQVDWVRALEQQVIVPRTQLFESTEIKVLDLDIIMDATAGMPMVRFPHKAHTEWLDCSNCHPKIFVEKSGANPVNMFAILAGEYCGRCHGAVAFPLTECRRCHSESRKTFTGKPGPQPTPGKNYPPIIETEVK
ncbi:c(7)-type cytochrome triheme domain-containing protein [Thalassotalea aquiviva]|uniref:c(7)-type cytochrome triheme domain-containing protein n=1 Tax=Thalassotalea aquiviva TaxID=3242415 RepID=UPI00352ADFE6